MKNPDHYRKGVGIVLLNKDKKVFVGQRIDKTSEAWQMPQGGIDEGEDQYQAVMRELMEEVGTDKANILHEVEEWLFYDLPVDIASKLWGGRYKGQMQKWFVIEFTGSDSDINIATEIPEFMTWKWANPNELLDMIVPFKRELYEAIFKRIPAYI
jgi:putative (di)nucleoside polyphosphate hydrolase